MRRPAPRWLLLALMVMGLATACSPLIQSSSPMEITIETEPSEVPPTAEQLVRSYDVIATGRVVEVLPATWTTPDGKAPARPHEVVPNEVTIVIPAVLELDGPLLVNRPAVDLPADRIIVATEGGQIGDDRLTAETPLTSGERILVGLKTFDQRVAKPDGLVATPAGPAWYAAIRYVLTDGGLAVPEVPSWGQQPTDELLDAITAASDASDTTGAPPSTGDMPIPDADGFYRDITADEARLIVPFDVVMPEELPEGLAAPSIAAEESARIEGLVTRPDAKMYTVTSTFGLTDDATSEQAIRYIQTNRMMQNPPWGEMSVIELGGNEINKAIVSGMGGPTLAVYWWQVDGVYVHVSAEIDDTLNVDLVEALVAAIQRSAPRQ